jgi:hypothetical protein
VDTVLSRPMDPNLKSRVPGWTSLHFRLGQALGRLSGTTWGKKKSPGYLGVIHGPVITVAPSLHLACYIRCALVAFNIVVQVSGTRSVHRQILSPIAVRVLRW